MEEMLLAGMVSEAQIIRGILVTVGIWFLPPIVYILFIRWIATPDDENQQPPQLPRWPAIAWLFGAPLFACIGGQMLQMVF
jgi:hypothetical protein